MACIDSRDMDVADVRTDGVETDGKATVEVIVSCGWSDSALFMVVEGAKTRS